MVVAEAFSMGIKAGVEPLALWEAVRTGASAPSIASKTGFCQTSTTLQASRMSRG
jgi:3-hydroxyisobutyrate dehydrogenase-like beta-hydroxyacid dehydrogenase